MPSPILTVQMNAGNNLIRNDGGPHLMLCGSVMRRMFDMTGTRGENVVVRLYNRKVSKSIPIRIKYSVGPVSSGLFGSYEGDKVRWTTSTKCTPRAFLLPSVADFVKSSLLNNKTQTKTFWLCVSCGRKRLDPRI